MKERRSRNAQGVCGQSKTNARIGRGKGLR